MNGNTPEIRTIEVGTAELRVERSAEGKPTIRGLAVPYGPLSVELGGAKGKTFRERFAPGAFTKSLRTNPDIRALVNHDPSLILGRSTSRTLLLFDGPDGLRYSIDPPDTELARHYLSAIERGDMTGSSFRFYTNRDKWTVEDGLAVRTVEQADIDDVSIVTYPAYPDTTAALRSLEAEERRRGEASPRRLTMSRRAARLRLAECES